MDEHPVLDGLSRSLWGERQIATYLWFKVTVANVMAADDDSRLLTDTLREIGRTVLLLHQAAEHRRDAMRRVADTLQLEPEPTTLAELARRVPEPYDELLREHQHTFHQLATELEQSGRQAVPHLRSRLEDVIESLRRLAGDDLLGARHLDALDGVLELQTQEVGLDAASRALDRAVPPSLVTFLTDDVRSG